MISRELHRISSNPTRLLKNLLLASLSLALVTAWGCSEDQPTSVTSSELTTASGQTALSPAVTPTVVTLLAGQTIDAGTVTVSNDAGTLSVTFETTPEWWIDHSHVHVATTLPGVPATRTGNPIPGRFDYKETHDPRVQSFTYQIPVAEIEGFDPEVDGSLVIAAHAELAPIEAGATVLARAGSPRISGVDHSEGAWGAGPRFVQRGNWATYIEYEWQVGEPAEVIYAVAYVDADPNDGPYNPDVDPLIAKLIEASGDQTPGPNDKIITDFFPTSIFTPNGPGGPYPPVEVTVKEHIILSVEEVSPTNVICSGPSLTRFEFKRTASREYYWEQGVAPSSYSRMEDAIGLPEGGDGCGIQPNSPSLPPFSAGSGGNYQVVPEDHPFIDVEILYTPN